MLLTWILKVSIERVLVSNSGAILLLHVWFISTYHFGVYDLPMAVGWDVFVVDDMEGLCTLDSLLSAGGILANALAEMPKFVGVRLIPGGLVFRMVTVSTVFECHS